MSAPRRTNMIRTLDLISNHRRGGSTTNHKPQDRCRISDHLILAWRRKPLYASASLFFLKCISNAPLAAQNRLSPPIDSQEQLAPYLTPQRIVKITDDRSINFVCLG